MPGHWLWPEQNGVSDETNVLYTNETLVVFAILDEWFRALEDGTAVHRMPDPDYPREFTEEQLDNLISVALDEWFENSQNKSWALNNRKIWHDAPPEFRRLEPAQRLALAQDLHRVLYP